MLLNSISLPHSAALRLANAHSMRHLWGKAWGEFQAATSQQSGAASSETTVKTQTTSNICIQTELWVSLSQKAGVYVYSVFGVPLHTTEFGNIWVNLDQICFIHYIWTIYSYPTSFWAWKTAKNWAKKVPSELIKSFTHPNKCIHWASRSPGISWDMKDMLHKFSTSSDFE